MDKIQSLKKYGFYLDEVEGYLYLLEGTDHFKTLLVDQGKHIFKEDKCRDSYQLVVVDMANFSGDVVEAYVTKADYKTVVYPLYRGKEMKLVYRNLETSKKYDNSKGDLKLGAISCIVGIDKENINNANLLAEDIMEVLGEFVDSATDNSIMYQLRVGTVLLNSVFGGVEMGTNLHRLLFRYFSAMCVEGANIKVGLSYYCRL